VSILSRAVTMMPSPLESYCGRPARPKICITSRIPRSWNPPRTLLYTSVPLMITVCAGRLDPTPPRHKDGGRHVVRSEGAVANGGWKLKLKVPYTMRNVRMASRSRLKEGEI